MSYNSLFGFGSHSPDADLLSHMQLQDDTSGNVIIDRIAANGSFFNVTNTSDQSVAGHKWLSKALNFGGGGPSGEWISGNLLTDAEIGPGRTFLAWWRPTSASSTRQMMKHGSFSTLRMFNDVGTPYVSVRDSTQYVVTNFTNPFTLNAWSHRGFVWSPGLTQTYEEGVAGASGVTDSTLNNGGVLDWLYLGDSSTDFAGDIQDSCFFDRALSAAEVAEVYNGPEPLFSDVYPVLSATSTTWTGTAGSWDGRDNGTLTYDYRVVEKSTGLVVSEGNSTSVTLPGGSTVGFDHTDLELFVVGRNDGGIDIEEEQQEYPKPTFSSLPGCINRWCPTLSSIVNDTTVRDIASNQNTLLPYIDTNNSVVADTDLGGTLTMEARQQNGTSGFYSTKTRTEFSGDYSTSFWYKPFTPTQNGQTVGSLGSAGGNTQGMRWYINPGGDDVYWTIHDPSQRQFGALELGIATWDTFTHIACVNDTAKDERQIWINGQLGATATPAGGTIPGGVDWPVQHSRIDDFCVFNRALSSAEVVELFDGKRGYQPGGVTPSRTFHPLIQG